MLLLMATLPHSLAHTSDGGTGGCGEDGGSNRNSGRWLSTYCVSRYGKWVRWLLAVRLGITCGSVTC